MNPIYLRFFCSSYAFLIVVLILNEVATDSVTVKTKYGNIQGQVIDAPSELRSTITKINTFRGIPYAAPPVGELRFQPPKPPTAWKPNVYNATYFRGICFQTQIDVMDNAFKRVIPNFGKKSFSEDCLYLDVYAPAQNDSLNPTTRYPVMFYIHGGGFVVGSGILASGLGLCTYGVVVVTIQYRLGPLGFMSTGDANSPGNYGMLDQVQALKWVKENIENFGGDPDKVTIFGLSAGGASVGLQLLSPLSKNLFHGAISESGASVARWAAVTGKIAKEKTIQLAKNTGCDHNELVKIAQCLKTKDAWNITLSGGLLWSPVVDKEMRENPFLKDTPLNLMKNGSFVKIPYMVGFMANEGASFLAYLENITMTPKIFKATMKNFASDGLNPIKEKEVIQVIQDAMEFQYTPWGYTADPLKMRQGVVDSYGDDYFVAPSVQACNFHSAHAQTYLFEVTYRPSMSLAAKWMGATHGDNVWFTFGFPFFVSPSYTADDKNVSLLVMKMYTDFAKVGNPTPEPLSNGIIWSAYNLTSLAYLQIQPVPVMKKNFQPHRMAFWNEYRPQLLKHSYKCNSTDGNETSRGTRGTCSRIMIATLLICGLFLRIGY